jgi:molybdate transport repressor ModE-like protein
MTAPSPWPDIDTVDLRLLIDVRRTGSIRSAAIDAGMSQPSASARLSALERRMGATLLDRSTRGATLTPAGDAVYGRAVRMLDLLAAARSDALELGGRQRLALGAPASLAPGLAVLLSQNLPTATTVTWRSDHTSRLLEAVLDTTLDAAIVTQGHGPSGLSFQQQWDEPITVTVRPDHPLARETRVDVTDMAQHPVALHLWGEPASETVAALGARCRLTIVSPAGAAVALALATDHAAITFAIASEAETSAGRLIQIPVRGLALGTVSVSIAHRTDRANQVPITLLKRALVKRKRLWQLGSDHARE